MFAVNYYLKSRLKNSKDILDEEIPITVLQCDEIKELPDVTEKDKGFTCTGLTYDSKRNSFWVGNYGKLIPSEKTKEPSIIQLSDNFETVLCQISMTGSDIDIQGVAYDEGSDTLWYSNGECVINCDLKGTEIRRIELGKYKKYKPNGVLYDDQTSTIWILCFYNYLLHYDLNGELINSYRSDYIGQDHLCFNDDRQLAFSAGIDYDGEDNYVVVYSMEDMKIKSAYKVIDSYSIEGISIVDSILYVVNDGLYHDAKINKNVVVKYTLPD